MAAGSSNSNSSSSSSILQALNVKVIGTGDRFLVLALGLGTDQSIWQRIIPLFFRHYRIVLFDLVCAGTVNPDIFDFRRYTVLDSYAEDLLSILDAVGVRCCAYVGHSLSAMIGILASVKRPELFERLILIGATPKFQNDGDYHGGFDREVVDVVFAAMESNYAAWVHGFAPVAVGADLPAAVREFSRTLFNMRPDISLFMARMAFEVDIRGVLGMVRTPCYIIQTARDMAVPESVAAYMQSHLGGPAKVEVLNTEGHLPHLTAPVLVIRAIQRALAGR